MICNILGRMTATYQKNIAVHTKIISEVEVCAPFPTWTDNATIHFDSGTGAQGKCQCALWACQLPGTPNQFVPEGMNR